MKDNIKFISTKLKMPVPRKGYIKRKELMLKLDSALEYKLTVVKGPAASGKTTLVTSFISGNRNVNYKWISLDNDNNNLFSFWYYFIEAVKPFFAENSTLIFDFFNAIISKNDIDNLITMIINSFSTEENLLIVFDDFHYITDEYLLGKIEYFIKHSPENVHFIILSREQPKMYLSDLVMSQKMLEIGEEELKFSEAEGRSFLKETLRLELEDAFIDKISSLSEGWVGGLQLIALASGNKKLNDIKILNKYMTDYLSNEILNSLDEEKRNFLIKTSVLSYFSVDIANKLLGISNSAIIIDELIDKNLFIINIDEAEGIFRYHNIFGEFLKLQFEAYEPGIKEQVHMKAAEIFEALMDLEESLNHLLCIRKYEEALSILEKLGQNPKGWSLLDKIPREVLLVNKGLTLQKFFHHFCNAEMEECGKIIEDIREREDYRNMGNILEFTKALYFDDKVILYPDAITFEDIEKLDISEVTKAILYLGISAFLSVWDNHIKAKAFIDRALEIEKQYNNLYIKYFAVNSKAQVREELGDLSEAESIYSESFKMIEQYPILGKIKTNAYIGVVGIYLKSFQLQKAEAFLEKARELIIDDYIWMRSGYLYNLIEYKLLAGQKKEVLKLTETLLMIDKYNKYIYSGVINFLMIADAISNEKLEQYIKRCEVSRKLSADDKLVYSRALFMQGEAERALDIINEVLEDSRKKGIKTKIVLAALLKIRILNGSLHDNKREILNLLIEAVHYSYENRYIEPYIFDGDIMRKYLCLLKTEKSGDFNVKEKSFIDEISGYVQNDKNDEILSSREKEVLGILISGATNKEIGEMLCISISTVKTHIINIYSKLDVSNRVEAVEKARELGITS